MNKLGSIISRNSNEDGDGANVPDFEDPDNMDFHDSDKRQFDDYGHMRFGKRSHQQQKPVSNDYGHMRFGRSLVDLMKSETNMTN
jgi:hypothetical protein